MNENHDFVYHHVHQFLNYKKHNFLQDNFGHFNIFLMFKIPFPLYRDQVFDSINDKKTRKIMIKGVNIREIGP